MKKTYIIPSVTITEIAPSQMVCESVQKYGDTNLTSGNLSKGRKDEDYDDLW